MRVGRYKASEECLKRSTEFEISKAARHAFLLWAISGSAVAHTDNTESPLMSETNPPYRRTGSKTAPKYLFMSFASSFGSSSSAFDVYPSASVNKQIP